MEKYYVYILYSRKDKNFYIGCTQNLINRFKQHNKGSSLSTKNRRPFILIHYEYFINKKDALAREIYLKSGYGHKQIYSMTKNTLEYL